MLEKEEIELTDEGVTEEDLLFIDESLESPVENLPKKTGKTKKKAASKKTDKKDAKANTTKKDAKKSTTKTEKKASKKVNDTKDTKETKTKKAINTENNDVPKQEIKETELTKISGLLNNFINDLNVIQSNQYTNKELLQEEFKELKENFVIQLAQFFDNVSFTEEAEDIKDCVTQISDNNKVEMMDEVRQVISDNVEMLVNNQNDTNTEISEAKDLVSNIESKLDGFLAEREEDGNSYLYSMAELEADIANLRLMLNGIDSVVRDEVAKNDRLSDITGKFEPIENGIDRIEREFTECSIHDLKNILDVISEDTTSISKRTNKLILTSDDTSKELKKNVQDFQNVLDKLSDNLEDFQISDIKKYLEKLNISVNSILKSNKVMNDAFMHLAEWIDATSDIFDGLKHNSELLTNTIQNKEQLVMDVLESKFEDLDERMAEMEEKISTMLKAKSKKGLDGDLKTTVDFIASQAAAANENSREIKTLYQKVEMVEFQLNKFDKNISKILAYIDED